VPLVSYDSQHQERTAAVKESVSDNRRIAVLRCNALGDYLMTTPALTALRDTFPHAEITLLAGAWHADFLSGRPSPVDRVLVVPEVAGLAGQPSGAPPRDALPRFLADARSYRYDLAVQLHGGGASNPLAGRPLVDRAARRERCRWTQPCPTATTRAKSADTSKWSRWSAPMHLRSTPSWR
jgi:hypothetical protein